MRTPSVSNSVAKFVAMASAPMLLLASLPASALNLNYDSLSSLEQPLAAQYADITFNLTGLVDASLNYSSNDNDSSLLGNFQVSAETQLANSWTLGAAYFAEYSSADNDNDNYSDNAGVYLGGVWGTVSIGNVTGLVGEQTRRSRGIGNAGLDFDDQLGQLDDTGLAYVGRFGATRLIATIDDDGSYEIGGVFQRPIGNKDYRFSLQYRDSTSSHDDAVIEFDSKGLGVVAELTYASSVFDFGVGLEQISINNFSVDRRYVSFGAAHKVGVLTFSVEAHFGDTDGDDETSYAAGLSYDIARGMSLNAGLNYSDAQVDLNGFTLLDDHRSEGILSVRYSF
jgi:hypothetical protein